MRLLLFFWLVVASFVSRAQDLYVFTDTNGAVQFPTNFWIANSNSIVQAISGAFPGGGGGGGGGGTVTSVAIDPGTTGLTFSGGPVTTNGTFFVDGTLALENGGTGANDAGTALANLGAAAAVHNQAYTTVNAFPTGRIAGRTNSGTGALEAIVAVPVANGGTGATNAAGARTSLGVAATSHSHTGSDIASGTVAVANGGTGSGTAAGARTNLGLVIGADVQAYGAALNDIKNLTYSDGDLLVRSNGGFVRLSHPGSNGKMLVSTNTPAGGWFFGDPPAQIPTKTLAHWTAKDYIPDAANAATFSSRSIGGSLVPSIAFLPDVGQGTSFEAAMPDEVVDLSAGVNVKLFWSTPLASAGSNVVWSVTVTNLCCGNTASATALITNAPSGSANEITNSVASFPTLTNLTANGLVKVLVSRVAGSASDGNPTTNELRTTKLYLP